MVKIKKIDTLSDKPLIIYRCKHTKHTLAGPTHPIYALPSLLHLCDSFTIHCKLFASLFKGVFVNAVYYIGKGEKFFIDFKIEYFRCFLKLYDY